MNVASVTMREAFGRTTHSLTIVPVATCTTSTHVNGLIPNRAVGRHSPQALFAAKALVSVEHGKERNHHTHDQRPQWWLVQDWQEPPIAAKRSINSMPRLPEKLCGYSYLTR